MKIQIKDELISLCKEPGSAVASLADQMYDLGYEEGQSDAEDEYEEERSSREPNPSELLEFAISKFKEMQDRSISSEQMLAELESELCTHMPVTGKTLFNK